MKLLKVMTIFIVLSVAYTGTAIGVISIIIDKIESNEKIIGSVSGLNPNEYSSYKVIVYVHTDKWYIHPYAGQGEGLSWASIRGGGTWSIQTIKREFNADKVAALLVKRSYNGPDKTENIHGISNKASVIKNLTGTDDYGKL